MRLIPAQGAGSHYKVKSGDEFELKKGKKVIYIIKVSNTEKGIWVNLFDLKDNLLKTQYYGCVAVPMSTIRGHNLWDYFRGKAVYLNRKGPQLCPNGVVAVPEEREDTDKYILWCPTSKLPPKVVMVSEKKAKSVAESMTHRHGGTFYWAKLCGKSQLVETKTYKLVTEKL